MGMWRDYYCELSPFEFRLYQNAEERICCDNCSLVRCEDARIPSSEGRFELAFAGKRLYLRAANLDEAEDWVDRIMEAAHKCRPASRVDEHWEVLQPSSDNSVDERSSPSSAPSSPERGSSNDAGSFGGQEVPPLQQFDWTRTAELETDAIKESVLYLSTDSEARTWVPLVFSLSLEALKGFRLQEGRKLLRQIHLIEEIRDVVPEVSLGGPAFFKLLTVKESIRFRAENSEEARSWRTLIRGALESYLESGDDGVGHEEPAVVCLGVTGNLHRLVQYSLKEDGALLSHLCTVPSEKGLDSQSFKCAGKTVVVADVSQCTCVHQSETETCLLCVAFRVSSADRSVPGQSQVMRVLGPVLLRILPQRQHHHHPITHGAQLGCHTTRGRCKITF